MAEPENDTDDLLRSFNDALQTYAEIIGISTKKLEAEMRSLTVEKMRSESKSITIKVDSTARRAAQITFDLFINLGGFGAEVVGSTVWPFAALCFNGLKFLIQSGGHYKKHFTISGINETLHSVAPVLDDIRRYVDGFKEGVRMEISHQEVVQRRLKLFLEVCAITTKVHRDNGRIIGKIKNYAKSAAGDDGGVGLKLKEMEEAQKREQHILLGDVWKTNQMIGNYIDFKGVANTRALRKIKQMLPLSENSPCWDSSAETHTGLQESMMEDTGAWVLESEYFKSWADVRSDAEQPVLLFESESGSGKSHLCCAIINELYRQSDNRSNPALVAYFYFERPRQQSSKDIRAKIDVSFRDALAALIWQISERDSAFRTFLSLQSGSPRGYTSTAMLWDILMKFPRSQSSGSKKVFFLVIDGVNLAAPHGSDSLDKTLSHIIECVGELKAQNFQVRVLVSGTPECLKGLSDRAIESLKRIIVTDHNQEDIQRFVQTKMRELSTEWENKEFGTLFDELQQKTCRNAGGSYFKAIYAMDEIQQTDGSQEELESIRRRGPENDKELIAWHVNRLNNSLDREEIKQLNKILVCVHFMEQKPRVEHLKSFLRLDSKNDLPKKFGDKIQSRYGQLLAILPDKTVTTRSEDQKPPYMDLGRVEQQKPQSSSAGQQGGPSMTLPERSEIVVAQTLIQSHFPAAVVDRLGLNAFFNQLHKDREGPRPKIGINRVDGHLELVESLFQAVRSNGYACLKEYAGKSLLYHLKQVGPKDLANTEDHVRLRDMIGRGLVSFFTDEANVEAWLTKDSTQEIIEDWKNWYASLSAISKWLKDPEVKRSAGEEFDFQEQQRKRKEEKEKKMDNSLSQNLVAPEVAPPEPPATQAAEVLHAQTEQTSEERHEPESEKSSVKHSENKPEPPTREVSRQRTTDLVNRLASPEFLLSTPIKVLANKWLMDDKWDASFSFRCFLLFSSKLLNLAGDSKKGADIFLRDVLEHGFSEKRIPLQLIQSADTLASEILKSDPDKVFLRKAETYVTEKWSRQAIKILPNGTDKWKTSWCYARAFHFTHQHSKALVSLEMVIPQLVDPKFREKNPTEWTEMVDTLCKWYKEGHEYEKALKFFRRLQTAFPIDKGIMKRALQWVEENCDSRGLAKYLSIEQTAPVELFSSHAADPYFHHSICMALEKDLRGLDQIYNESVKAAWPDLAKRISLRYYHGLALFYQYQTGRAARVWNDNISDTEHILLKNPERRNELLLSVRTRSAERLASHYIQLIKKLRRYDAKSLDYLEKIKDLKLWNDRALAGTPHSLALLLGRAMHLMGRSTRVKNWCVREHIQKSMELLSDDTIFNDWEGYWLLCQAFIPLKDDANALAAWSLIVDDYFYMNRGCAGGCGCTWSGWADNDMYVCRDCADVQFDEPCWLRLKDGKLEEHVCGKDHEFIVLPRWEAAAAAERLSSQTVNVGGVEMNIEEWKRDVRRQYGLEPEEKTGRLRSLAKRLSKRK